jgi:Flp pilus assembly protein TadD
VKSLLERFGRRFASSLPPEGASPPAALPQLGDAIQLAIGHHQAGRLTEAESLYKQILVANPEQFDAIHLLGVLSHQTGDTNRAVALIGRASAIRPDDPAVHLNLGVAYQALRHLDNAEACFRRALALKPDWENAHNSLGTVLHARGDHAAAEFCFRQAVTCNPASAEALNNLGNALKERGALDEAEDCYRKAVALQPNLAEGHFNLGGVLQQRAKLDEAEAAYRRALALRPNYAEACNSLGGVLQAQGRLHEAEASFLQALDINSGLVEAHCNLGDVLLALGRLDEAEAYCLQALALRPGYADALNNLAAVCKGLGRLDEAEDYCRQALALDPAHARALNTLGTIANERGNLDEAEALYRQALTLTPTSAAINFNLGMLRLLRGDYREGLALYEHRFETFAGRAVGSTGLYRPLAQEQRWLGGSLTGRSLLVWTEQGLGDSLMAMRFLPKLRERGAGKVIVHCESALERVVASMAGVDRAMTDASSAPFGEFDLHCPMLSLPMLFDARPDSIPNRVPYLVVPESLRSRWRQRLSNIEKRRVGLAWAGSKTLRADSRRSIPLSRFAPLLGIGGVQLISLQKGDAANQRRDWGDSLPDWMGDCADLMDTAALVDNLDLVITVDTSIAHLAGALGKPVWLLNRYESEWRWGLEREDSPWYPTMRILRQPERGDWDTVVKRVAANLARQTED